MRPSRRPINIYFAPGIWISYHQLANMIWTLPRHNPARLRFTPFHYPRCHN